MGYGLTYGGVMEQSELNMEQLQKCINMITETNTFLSVKSTNYFQGIGLHKRHGRFKMDNLEHNILKKEKGYYLFLLYSNKYLIKGKIIHADKLNYHTQMSWTKIIKINEGEINE